jgi:hypothetical protein
MQVGASNELPESEELDALYDRFLVRREVSQVCIAGARVSFIPHQSLSLWGVVRKSLVACMLHDHHRQVK